MHILKQIDLFLEKIEGNLIVLILSLMILLSFGQMLFRNFFDMEIIWSDTRFNKPILKLYQAVLPFLGLRLVGLILITYVPAISLFLVDWVSR